MSSVLTLIMMVWCAADAIRYRQIKTLTCATVSESTTPEQLAVYKAFELKRLRSFIGALTLLLIIHIAGNRIAYNYDFVNAPRGELATPEGMVTAVMMDDKAQWVLLFVVAALLLILSITHVIAVMRSMALRKQCGGQRPN